MSDSEARFIAYAFAARKGAAETRSPVLKRHLLGIAVAFEKEALLVQQAYIAIAESRRVIERADELLEVPSGKRLEFGVARSPIT